ncbi:hypothetical protein BDN72DRAFT_836016 [Pluteus cervinus]|uniref:Uncharacterized protein n=1 Tax=Pluteus cervinus TaxID=181527 RepID=A0ACD3B4C4_9AGAR|nr:hypothetical protein BDN72DRAFT_836016 [Pluteus cervinus]
MSLLTTPLEVTDQILSEADACDLLALSRSCRALRHPSQRRLFRSIEIDRDSQFAQLYATFNELNPGLAIFVKVLQIFYTDPLDGEAYDPEDIHNENRPSLCLITSTSPFLPKMLDILPQLNEFLVHGPSNDHTWSRIPKETRVALMGLLRRSPHLSLLSLPGCVDLPMNFFSQVGSATRGSLKEVFIQQNWKDTQHTERFKIDGHSGCLHPLKSLAILYEGRPAHNECLPPDSDIHPPNWLGPKIGLDTTRLEDLSLRLNETFVSVKELLVSPTLKTLDLSYTCGPWVEQSVTGLDLSKLESLTSLRIVCDWYQNQGGPFSWMAHTLQTIALSDGRRDSSLTIDLSFAVISLPKEDCVPYISPLVDVLKGLYGKYTGAGRLPLLKQVTLSMYLLRRDDESDDELESLERVVRPVFKDVKPVRDGDTEAGGVSLTFKYLSGMVLSLLTE